MKNLNMVIPILMYYKHFSFNRTAKMYFVAHIRPAAASLLAAYIHLSTNEKQRYVMTSGLPQYTAGYTVANLWRYPIRRCVAFAIALESLFSGVATYTQKGKCVHIWTKNMGRFYHSSDGSFMLCVRNLCMEPILNSLSPILTEFVMMLVSPLHWHPLMICHQSTQSEWGPVCIQLL